jgi:RNA polymerase sigma-70 factor (ECF subfamily)
MATDLVLGRWIPFRTTARESEWEALYVEQLPRIYNFFRYRVGHGPEAEDLTSLTFEKAWTARDSYRRDRAGFGTWLLAVARNVAVDHYRSGRNRQMVPLDEVDQMPAGPTPEDLSERRSDAEHLARLLGRLPGEERELLALKYGVGLTNRQIARLTGLSESNVGTRAHRIVARLKAEWNEKEIRR